MVSKQITLQIKVNKKLTRDYRVLEAKLWLEIKD